MNARIVLLPGDGIGPEVIDEARKLLEHVAQLCGHRFTFETYLIGGAAIDALGEPLPASTLEACRRADAVMLGAVGGPKWDLPDSRRRPEDGLLGLRKELDLFANLRPVRPHPDLMHVSPLRPEHMQGVDLLIVRELTGGLYFGRPSSLEDVEEDVRAVDTLEYTGSKIRRLVEKAFQLAEGRRNHLISVDKANVLQSSRLWRSVVDELAALHPKVTVEHILVDTAAMLLVSSAASFDVLVTENLFGDILSDEASILVGSIGLLPSASLGVNGGGLFEPVHGSAPDITGQGIANPIGALLSAALLLNHALDLPAEAGHVEAAVASALASGVRTPDLGGSASTADMGAAVRQMLSAKTAAADAPSSQPNKSSGSLAPPQQWRKT